MGSTHRSILEALPGSEMATRTASMVGYLKEFGDHHGSREVKVALLEEEKKIASLRAGLEALKMAHKEAEKRSTEVRSELTEMSAKFNEAVDLLKKARVANSNLAKECDELKLAALAQKEVECKLREENITLNEDL